MLDYIRFYCMALFHLEPRHHNIMIKQILTHLAYRASATKTHTNTHKVYTYQIIMSQF